MAAFKMAVIKVTPPNEFPLGLIRSHMVVIHLFLMLCDLQRVVRDLCPTLYMYVQVWQNREPRMLKNFDMAICVQSIQDC
jgi:hypothetical protein